MAYTTSFVAKTVFGNLRANVLRVTADAATQTVETGMGVVAFHAVSPISMATSAIKVAVNSNASGVNSNGVIGISGAASGDVFFVTVFGN